MELAPFLESRRPRWSKLESLLDRAEARGLSKLDLDDAKALSKLYRGASSDLLFVRARGGAAEVTEYLNALVGRAYALTYPGKRVRLGDAVSFVTRGFPRLMLRESRMFVAALALFWAGFGFGWLGMAHDPEAGRALVPEQHQDLDPTARAEREKTASAGVDEQVAFTSFLFTHNISVAFLAFALGLTAGVLTAVMLFSNGLLLGALFQVYLAKGLGAWFWAWILPHGIPEITAICIAGAGGLVLARGLVAPSGLPRRLSLRREAGTAVKLLFGTLALFVLAGCIEGTISQIHPPRLSIAFKLSFALVVGLAVYAYLFSAAISDRAKARAARGT